MSSKLKLKLDFCSYEAARFAVMNWHYSKKMPAGKLVKIGVWENDKFIGCVIFGRGANNNIGKAFNLKQTEICELVRVALMSHETPVTRIVSISMKLLKRKSPGLKMVVSYADPRQGHNGVIYKAGNWVYLGLVKHKSLIVNGKRIHNRTISSRWGSHKNIPGQVERVDDDKHKFAYALDPKCLKMLRS